MIFVTVGTHHQPFTRLLRAARDLDLAEQVQIQDTVLPPRNWDALVRGARLVVCHAGPATIESVVKMDKIPIVVPRRRLWREHVDDHQLHYARQIAERVHVLFDPSGLESAIARHDEVVRGLARPWRSGVSSRWLEHLRGYSTS